MSHIYNVWLSSEDLDLIEVLHSAVTTSSTGSVSFSKDSPYEEVLRKILEVRNG